VVFFLLSCASNEEQSIIDLKSYIIGNAQPIKLSDDTSKLKVSDLFADINGFESASIGDKKLEVKENKIIIPNDWVPAPVSNLRVIYKGAQHDIPLFKSEKLAYTFNYNGGLNSKTVGLAGSVNGWNYKADSLTKTEKGWSKTFKLAPGRYPYRIWVDGKEGLDETNPNTMDNGLGGLNNYFIVGIENEKVELLQTLSPSQDTIFVKAPASLKNILAYLENRLISVERKEDKAFIVIPRSVEKTERTFVRFYADNGSKRTNDLLIPLQNGRPIQQSIDLKREDLHATVMYFMMVDRFMDGDSTNNRPTPDPAIKPQANNLGGDLQGITQKIKDGYFQSLGINTIWISPISRNAEGAWGLWDKGTKSTFSAYHGYWPTALTKIDDRFGNEKAFRELIDLAHENGINVILDYVAHHVHQDHILYKQHPEWTTQLYLPDGTLNTERWDEHRLTTWFDKFLPTWDFSKPEVVSALTDTAMYWVTNYELDGFRHDATKHIPTEFWEELTKKVKSNSKKKLFQIGETYGSPELISSYITNGQLDAQFDFNLYDAIVDAFAKDETSFDNLDRVLNESLKTYGHHHLMGNITGNQDRARFISYADGSVKFSEDAKLAGWTRDIQNQGEVGFNKMASLQAFLMTTPGIPCVYYGDEIGLPGGNDPDNRRMMKFQDWNDNQKKLHDVSSRLIQLRRSNLALSYGELIPLYKDPTTFVFARNYLDETTIVVFTKGQSSSAKNISFDWPFNEIDLKKESFFGQSTIQINGRKCSLDLKGESVGKYGFEIFYN
jgi:glycosidase